MLSLENFRQRLTSVVNACESGSLSRIKKGIERETLRVTPEGKISQRSHPVKLGSALTHPAITTDYAEALLEFVTPPFTETNALLKFLTEIHQFVNLHINDEILWAFSMPCRMGSEDEIKIADYGRSNLGQLKHIYRRGLEHRYGKTMQCISGVHYNFSLPPGFWYGLQKISDRQSGDLRGFIDDAYFNLIRNFECHAWLMIYLFGASPVVCKSFFTGRLEPTGLESLDAATYYKPHATSLRMSDFGYKSKVQQGMNISYNHLDEYIDGLVSAMTTSVPEYEKIGTKEGDKYIQLNTNYLQIENEYYGLIRPKRVVVGHERSTQALKKRGVEYIEVRCLDVNPLDPLGVDRDQLCFIDVFLLYCALEEAPFIDQQEMKRIRENHRKTVYAGRDTSLRLMKPFGGGEDTLKIWGEEIFARLESIAAVLDQGTANGDFVEIVKRQRAKLNDPDQTPSGIILKKLQDDKVPFSRFAMDVSLRYKRLFREMPLARERSEHFEQMATDSLREQADLERGDTLPLGEFMAAYLRVTN